MLLNVDHPYQLSSRLCGTLWLQRLAYLAYIFRNTGLNKLNLSLQGTTITLISARKKMSPSCAIQGFVGKSVEKKCHTLFSDNKRFFNELESHVSEDIPSGITGH
jgi:hypothetical protein